MPRSAWETQLSAGASGFSEQSDRRRLSHDYSEPDPPKRPEDDIPYEKVGESLDRHMDDLMKRQDLVLSKIVGGPPSCVEMCWLSLSRGNVGCISRHDFLFSQLSSILRRSSEETAGGKFGRLLSRCLRCRTNNRRSAWHQCCF